MRPQRRSIFSQFDTFDFGDIMYTVQGYHTHPDNQRYRTHPGYYFETYRLGTITERFSHIPYDDLRFAYVVRNFCHRPGSKEKFYVLVGDTFEPVVLSELKRHSLLALQGADPIWCVVANVKEERPYGPGKQEVRRGTKHFAPGAKVYCAPVLWGDGYEKIKVVGHHRATHRYVTMVIRSEWLTNWRVELAYSPYLIYEMMALWDDSAESKSQAQELVNWMTERNSPDAKAT